MPRVDRLTLNPRAAVLNEQADGASSGGRVCVFADGDGTRVSVLSTTKSHAAGTAASASRQRARSGMGRSHDSLLDQQEQEQEQEQQARSFAFDRVFEPGASQEDVYESAARPLVRAVVEGCVPRHAYNHGLVGVPLPC